MLLHFVGSKIQGNNLQHFFRYLKKLNWLEILIRALERTIIRDYDVVAKLAERELLIPEDPDSDPVLLT